MYNKLSMDIYIITFCFIYQEKVCKTTHSDTIITLIGVFALTFYVRVKYFGEIIIIFQKKAAFLDEAVLMYYSKGITASCLSGDAPTGNNRTGGTKNVFI